MSIAIPVKLPSLCLELISSATFGQKDLLGSSSFSVVKSDMTGNVAKIRTKFLENPAAHNTLQAIVLVEKDLGKKRVATEGLLWLMRGLQFTSQALRRNLDDPSEELSVSFQSAYGATLSKFHSFMIKPIFSVIVVDSISVSNNHLHPAGNEGMSLSC